jgi:hypothetical protein
MPLKKITFEFTSKRGFFTETVKGTATIYDGPPMPGAVKLFTLSQGENKMLNFKLVLPPPSAADVVSVELKTRIGEADEVINQYPPSQAEVDGFSGQDGDVVLVSLVDIDDAGNRSPAREQSFSLTDTIAPPQPGEIGMVVTGEE